MADFVIPPIEPAVPPAPLSPTVPLNPPMVGTASPFDHVDGQNRDLILEAIRAWSRGSLREWIAEWRQYLIDYTGATDEWLNSWAEAVQQYVEAAIDELRQEIIDSTIAISDPVISAVLRDLDSDSRQDVDDISILAIERRMSWNVFDHGIVHNTPSQEAALNALILALSEAGGGDLLIPTRGIVEVGDTIIAKSGVRLVIAPGATLRKNAAGNSVFIDIYQVDGFSIIGGGTLDYGPRTVTPTETPLNKVAIRNSQNITIEGMQLVNCSARPVYIESITDPCCVDLIPCDNVRVSKNRFGVVKDLAVYSLPNMVAPTTRLYIEDNYFEGVDIVTPEFQPWTAIYVGAATDVFVRRNEVAQSDDTAIMLGQGVLNFEVVGNFCRTHMVCIFLGAVGNGHVTGNDLSSETDIGISFYPVAGATLLGDLLITDNIIKNCGRPGIMVEGGSGFTITGNRLVACCKLADSQDARYNAAIAIQGVGVRPSTEFIIADNNITRGTFTATAQVMAVSVRDSATNYRITNNNAVGFPAGANGLASYFVYGAIVGAPQLQHEAVPFVRTLPDATASTIDGSLDYDIVRFASSTFFTISGISASRWTGKQMRIVGLVTGSKVAYKAVGGADPGMAPVILKGNVDATVPLDGVLTLEFDAGQWREVSRSW